MGLRAVAAALCLLVAAGSLPVVPAGVDHAGGPGECNTATVAKNPTDGLVVTVVPYEGTLGPDEQGVVLICIVNPPENDATVDFFLVVEHNRDPNDADLFLVGPRVGLGEEPTQQVMPLDRRVEDGWGRFVSPGDLPPGTGAQYAVVVADAEPGDYEIEASVEWDPIRIEEESVLHVTGSQCKWFCRLGQSVDGAVAVLVAGVAFLLDRPGVTVAAVGVIVALLASRWWRSRLGFDPEVREEDGESRRGN